MTNFPKWPLEKINHPPLDEMDLLLKTKSITLEFPKFTF